METHDTRDQEPYIHQERPIPTGGSIPAFQSGYLDKHGVMQVRSHNEISNKMWFDHLRKRENAEMYELFERPAIEYAALIKFGKARNK